MSDMILSASLRREGFSLRRGTAMNDNQCEVYIQLCTPIKPPTAVATVMITLIMKLQTERDDELLIVFDFK